MNERVSIFVIRSSSKRVLVPVFSACRPKVQGDGFSERDVDVRRRFQKQFMKPLEAAMDIPDGASKESPIAQALVDLSLSDFLRGETGTLLVFSDLMENTDRFTLYECTSGTDSIRRYRESRIGSQERPAFGNVRVVLSVVPTEQARPVVNCRSEFWNWFFGNNSGPAANLTVDYLPGYGGK